MADGNVDASRRAFLLTAAGGAAAGAAGTAAAQDGNETAGGTATPATNATAAAGNATAGGGNQTAGGTNGTDGGTGGVPADLPQPKYGDWFTGVGNFTGSTANRMGQDTVTVRVGAEGNGGNLAFAPPAVHVSAGATVRWEWTGGGGGHNVVSEGEGPLDSDLYSESGVHYEYTFEDDGMYKYYCSPHRASGMKAAIVVGTDYPAVEQDGASGPANPLPASAKSLGVASTFVMSATLGLAYVFLKYGGNYGTAGEE